MLHMLRTVLKWRVLCLACQLACHLACQPAAVKCFILRTYLHVKATVCIGGAVLVPEEKYAQLASTTRLFVHVKKKTTERWLLILITVRSLL